MYQLKLIETPSTIGCFALSKEWEEEAYVSLHLVQEMLKLAGLPQKSAYSHWIPQYKVKFPNSNAAGKITETDKKVDFLIEDYSRHINFLIKVKSAKSKITDAARLQLKNYLRYSHVRFGLLIDPYTIEVYEFHNLEIHKIDAFEIEDPKKVEPVSSFLKAFLERIKMRTIAIHTSKGGVGKTTLTVNLAYELAQRGKRVLVIDLDDQANASLSLGVNKADEFDQATTLEEFEQILNSFQDRKEVVDFLRAFEEPGFKTEDFIRPTLFSQIISASGSLGKIDVLPSSYKTTDNEIQKSGGAALPQKRLDKALQKTGLSGEYDYVIIDTPPSSTLTAICGLFAAQYVVIPTQLEYLSVHGIRRPIKVLQEVQENTDNKRGMVLGIVPMMTENVNLSKTIKSLIKKSMPEILLLPGISRAVSIGQASHARKPVSLYAQDIRSAARAAKEFYSLTDEIIKKIDSIENSIGA